MNLIELVQQKIGKRMAAFAWSAYMINTTEDFNGRILIAALTIAYMVCQTVSDWEGGNDKDNGK